MTTISATSSYYTYSNYLYAGTSGKSSSGSTSSGSSTSGSSSSATNITLSASAQAALAEKSFAEVIAETRTTLTDLLDKADSESPYKNGELVIDLAGFDRRELYAIAGNTDGTFTADEIAAAADELALRFDQAMAGPAAVYNVTGNITKIYASALTSLEAASPEEQQSADWIASHDAVTAALAEIDVNPGVWPEIENDPVIDYLARVTEGTANTERDFSTVASDARTALDAQIAAAEAVGKRLVFSEHLKSGVQADFSDFSSRALSAIALNSGDQFSAEEMRAAQNELNSRSRSVLLSCFENADSSTPTSLAENIISAYGSLSSEERLAVGWGEDFYAAALANYNSASYLTNMLSGGLGASLGTSASTSSSGWPF